MGAFNHLDIAEIAARGSIKDADIPRLLRALPDGTLAESDAERLIGLHRACPVQGPDWGPCFVDLIADYIVNQAAPAGYLTAANADWLIARLAPEGRIETRVEFDLLVAAMELARWSPVRLVVFALDGVRRAIVDGAGVPRGGAVSAAAGVTDADAALVRRILIAFGGRGAVAITRAELDSLLDLDAATAGSPPPVGWQALFLRATANAVMAASGYAVPTRAEALAEMPWSEQRGHCGPILQAYCEQTLEDRAITRLERQRLAIITGDDPGLADAQWLVRRLRGDAPPTPNIEALLAALAAEQPRLDAALAALLGDARRAA